MPDSLKFWLKTKFPLLLKIKHALFGPIEVSSLNVLSTFPSYSPNSAGDYENRAVLTIQAINQVFPSLSQLSRSIHERHCPVQEITRFPTSQSEQYAAIKLKTLFDQYGSDKANRHNYHHVYGVILQNPSAITGILEIGLGTNDPKVVSNMGTSGKPGASLRAFRDFCINAKVIGADIDRKILFTEERIETYYLDQTSPATFDQLRHKITSPLDLVIDDGLHSPHANIDSLRFALEVIKPGGWVVIEDIAEEAISLWETIAIILPKNRFNPHIVKSSGPLVFAVQKK